MPEETNPSEQPDQNQSGSEQIASEDSQTAEKQRPRDVNTAAEADGAVSDRAPELEPSRLPFPIVAIGASAGGLEAYVELLEALPDGTGMSFVFVPHIAAEQKSHLVEI